jgi:dGTPase
MIIDGISMYVPQPLQLYGCDPAATKGRFHPEPESLHRSPHQRDRDRIIHSTAFRRLKHKTQVFVEHEGDYYRTRLTHSLEVAQIARTCARYLGLNEDLAEAIALAHDLGHPPFGHAGEEVLNELAREYGGFDHNIQSMRVVTKLEYRYAEFDGLNLTWETLDGLVKHNGALKNPSAVFTALCQRYNIPLAGYSSLEAQVAALADDIAYNTHDIDDGLHAGIFEFDDLRDINILQPAFREVDAKYPDLNKSRRQHEVLRRVFGYLVEDLLLETKKRLQEYQITNADDVRQMPNAVGAFSEEMMRDLQQLRRFLLERMYRHYKVQRMSLKAKHVITALYENFVKDPNIMPPEWAQRVAFCETKADKVRVVVDYIAGMTDRYAIKEYQSILESI